MFVLAIWPVLGGFHWYVNRVYVPEGKSLLLGYKGPLVFGSRDTAAPGQFAEEGQIGVLRELRGPGRHFYCSIWWERKVVEDMIIRSGELGIVRSKMGTTLAPGQFLVDGELGATLHKGILRKALAPVDIDTIRMRTTFN